MRPTDRNEFGEVMRDAQESIGQGAAYTEGGLDLMFAAMQDLSLQQIQLALVGHINDPKNGKWRPNAAMIREQIERRAPVAWVSADEAWATAPKLESDAGVVNQVTVAALAVAQDLIDSGDMIGARRAFIDAYSARVEQAKAHPDPAQRVPVAFISGGNQPQRHEDAHGERMMLLERAQAAGQLPAPPGRQLLEHAPRSNSGPPPEFKALLLTMQGKTMPPPEAQDYER